MSNVLGAKVDTAGFLIDLSDWNKDIAIKIAADDNIELSKDHWEVINFLRAYFKTYKITPAMRIITRELSKKILKEKATSIYLYFLFPYGPIKQGCRIAGLPKPTGCF